MKPSLYLLMFIPAIVLSVQAVQNAGMLPYAYKDGIAYFLLGLENRSWQSQGWVWNDFGGRCYEKKDLINDAKIVKKFNIEQPLACAAREATEETRYTFGNPFPVTGTPKEFDQSLQYLIDHATKDFNTNGVYQQFFAAVDFIEADRFNQGPKVPNYEKQQYAWIPVRIVLKALDEQKTDSIVLAFPSTRSQTVFYLLVQTLRKSDVREFIENVILAKEDPKQVQLSTLVPVLENLILQLNILTQQLQQNP